MHRLILIDDEPLVRDTFARLLQVKGYDTIAFESAEDFLACADTSTAACLLVDFRLPGMNGCELLRILRDKGIETPAILLSGNVDDTVAALLTEIKSVRPLNKPCRSELLFATVEACISDNL